LYSRYSDTYCSVGQSELECCVDKVDYIRWTYIQPQTSRTSFSKVPLFEHLFLRKATGITRNSPCRHSSSYAWKRAQKIRDKWSYLLCKFLGWSKYLLEFFAFRYKYSIFSEWLVTLNFLDFINSEILMAILPRKLDLLETFCSERLLYRGDFSLYFLLETWYSFSLEKDESFDVDYS